MKFQGGGQGVRSIFDNMTEDDVIMAFFPCTRFQENNALLLSGKGSQQKNMPTQEKLYWAKRYHKELSMLYENLSSLVQICLNRNLKLIIENPATPPHYLSMYWLPSTFTDKDRTVNGDKFKKPTQYWFFNIEPKNNLLFEPIKYVETEIVNKQNGPDRQVKRSMIEPQYANRFIRTWILDEDGKA